MKQKKGPKDLQPAPGDLSLVQAFLNTVDREAGTDELASPLALAGWLKRHGLLAAGCELGPKDLQKVLRVREGWRSLLAGSKKEQAIIEALDEATAAAGLRVRHLKGCNIHFEPTADGLDGALGRLLVIAGEARGDGTWRRLRVCANPTCRAVFYDFSTNHSGKWCRPRCGNRRISRDSKRRNRRLSRQSSIDLRNIRPLGPSERVKADEVLREFRD